MRTTAAFRHALPAIAALVASLAARTAAADPPGTVPTSDQPGGRFLTGIDYEYQAHTALITREASGDPNLDPLAPLPTQHQLEAHTQRQLVTPHISAGVYRDLWLSLAIPIVVAQSSELDLASGASPATASTFTDGILPGNGFDARNPTTPPGGNVIFRDVNRAGIPELVIGIGYAPTNQATDATSPTWKLGIDLHLAVGKVMRFDAVDPSSETGVSTGVDELRLWTSLDRRYRRSEAWFDAYYQLPIATRSTSLFQDPGFGATNTGLAPTGGASFGAAALVFDDPAAARRLTIDLGARLTAHFAGRGYSEMWQAFAFAGDRRTAGPLILDADPVTPGIQAESHPGITNLESYLETAVRLAAHAELAPRITVSAFAELAWQTEHVISFADAGVDFPTCPTGAPRCENDNNNQVNAGTAEVNPLDAPLIDLVGHRYHAADSHTYSFGLQAQFAF